MEAKGTTIKGTKGTGKALGAKGRAKPQNSTGTISEAERVMRSAVVVPIDPAAYGARCLREARVSPGFRQPRLAIGPL